MYASGGIVMIVGVTMSLAFIAGLVWYVNRHIGEKLKTKAWLTRYVALLLAALVGLFIVDKVVSFKTKLLTDEMSNGMFELIKNIVLVIFGYEFGGNMKSDKDSE
jgi:apolipoprotein N-acyltransferase